MPYQKTKILFNSLIYVHGVYIQYLYLLKANPLENLPEARPTSTITEASIHNVPKQVTLQWLLHGHNIEIHEQTG